MHRMLPINRMYCSAEASQGDTPDKATEGCPVKRPMEDRRTEWEQLDQEERLKSAELSEGLKWELREEREGKQICRRAVKK